MSIPYVATAALAAALAAGAAWKVQDYRWTTRTQAAELARGKQDSIASGLREFRAKEERRLSDAAAGAHAAALATLNTELGDAHAHIKNLSSRQCLAAGTVRMLNAIGTPAASVGVRAPASNAAGAPQAAAGPAADDAATGYASERDTAGWIATCRAEYSAVSSQLGQILDIEDQRQPGIEAKAQD